MRRPRLLQLNLSAIGFRHTAKMAAQSYSEGIDQQNYVGLFRNSDWLYTGIPHLKLM